MFSTPPAAMTSTPPHGDDFDAAPWQDFAPTASYDMSDQIVFLAEQPAAIPEIAAWLFGQWGHRKPGTTVEDSIRRLTGQANPGSIPFALLALRDGAPAGTASLVEFDDPGDAPGPWVSSVFVHPDYRGHGIAMALMRRLEAEALRLGAAKLLLSAAVPELYSKLGFTPTGGSKHGEPLMEKRLTP